MDVLDLVEVQDNEKVEAINPGDTVKVNFQVREGSRIRAQAFEGTVIRSRGVERTFPRYSPLLQSVEVMRRGKVRRARLYYLRGRSGRAARVKELTRQRPS